MMKLNRIFIQIQWVLIGIAGIFLCVNWDGYDMVLLIWCVSILCNIMWFRKECVANIEYTYSHLFQNYPYVWIVIRLVLILVMCLYVIIGS